MSKIVDIGENVTKGGLIFGTVLLCLRRLPNSTINKKSEVGGLVKLSGFFRGILGDKKSKLLEGKRNQ